MTGTIALCSDHHFNFEVLRVLSAARYGGADVSEVLKAAALLKPGDFESYYDVFNKLALHINKQADAINADKHPVSARDAYFRAATYFRSAEFFLHGHPDDSRIRSLWDQQMTSFDKAIALLPQPGQRFLLKGDGFDIPAIFYPATSGDTATPKPTLIVGSGFDGSQEELLHGFGFAALERGYNFMTYEGPGQPTVRQQQGLGFIHNWEKVVSPVVDHLVERPEVDSKRLALVGWSLGGYLCVRAAAFEPRIAATVAVDGVFDGSSAFSGLLPSDAKAAYETGDAGQFNGIMEKFLASGEAPTAARWAVEHGTYSFAVNSFAEFMERVKLMTLAGIADKVKNPVLICEASDDMFFPGQPAMVKDALGDLGTHVILTDEDAASAHCHLGAFTFANQIVFDWLDDTLLK
ncbi:20-hydroxy-prefusarin hydrolase FUS2 [Curvularia clavata]|uniref:20-hydroxy-prefusarin hydrolase FUS2 n=1 Tax=Curvularia clavata TaxID=95742 RepID=A0A9Q8Z1R0_CURCL|nr:20-hydroxy-prefusarin hydrolase FUS2 [Curvularia clavata]